MNKAKVWYRKPDGELNSVSIKVDQLLEVHDGYVRIGRREDEDTEIVASIIPMHQVISIEEYEDSTPRRKPEKRNLIPGR